MRSIPPVVDTIRILAITGKQGKPPCLGEGSQTVSQEEVEASIDTDLRGRRWLTKHRLIKDGVVTLSLSIELYSQDRKVATVEAKDISLFIRSVKRKPRSTSDEVVLKSISALDSTIKNLGERLDMNWKTLTKQLDQRDTVIGVLVQRGLNPPAPPKAEAPAPQQDEFSKLIEKGGQFMQLMNMLKAAKDKD